MNDPVFEGAAGFPKPNAAAPVWPALPPTGLPNGEGAPPALLAGAKGDGAVLGAALKLNEKLGFNGVSPLLLGAAGADPSAMGAG